MTCKFVLALLCLIALTSCATELTDGPVVGSDEGSALLAEATRAAARTLSERKTATIQAATIVAASTEDAIRRAGTATAQSQQVRQTDMAANATSNALALQQVQTRQSATDTSEAQRTQAARTAESDSRSVSATTEAVAVQRAAAQTAAAATATSAAYAATSTRSAQDLAASLTRLQATATVEALDRQRIQSEQDAIRWTLWVEYVDTVLKFLFFVGAVALVIVVVVFVARYLDAIAIRSRMIETHAGTVMILQVNGKPYPQLVTAAAGLLDASGVPEEFPDSDLPDTEHQTKELLNVNQGGRKTVIEKTDPVEEARQVRYHLAKRLLRESIGYLNANQIDPRTVNNLPSFRDLNWSSETWVRAVESLKPHIFTKKGRGGGTFCSADFPSVMHLYTALGERRITLAEEAAVPTPLPAAAQAA